MSCPGEHEPFERCPRSHAQRYRVHALAPIVAIATLILGSSSSAADWIVGPPAVNPDFTSLQAAIQAASDGDTLLIDGGLSESHVHVINKSLRLVGFHGMPKIFHLAVRNLATSRTVTLQNLHVYATTGPGVATSALELRNNAGLVVAQNCNDLFAPSFGLQPVSISACSAVILDRMDFVASGENAGIYCENSKVWIHRSTFAGGFGDYTVFSSTPGAPGIVQVGGEVSVFASNLYGGDGGTLIDDFGLTFGSKGGAGAEFYAGAVFRHQDSAIVPGSNGGDYGYTGPPATQFSGDGTVTALPGKAARFELGSPSVELGSLQVEVKGEGSSSVLLLLGFSAAAIPVNGVLGTLALGLGPSLIVSAFPPLPANGVMSFATGLPALPAGIRSLSIDAQVLVAPPSGTPSFSNPAPLTVLSASL